MLILIKADNIQGTKMQYNWHSKMWSRCYYTDSEEKTSVTVCNISQSQIKH